MESSKSQQILVIRNYLEERAETGKTLITRYSSYLIQPDQFSQKLHQRHIKIETDSLLYYHFIDFNDESVGLR